MLESIAAQTSLGNRTVYLFQDNSVSANSGRRYAEDSDIQACLDVFREIFPCGTPMLAEHNCGIARNFLRAEEFVFAQQDADACFFFEDDMVLSPHYLSMMDQVCDFARKNEKVGYFAAYGAFRMSLAKQKLHQKQVRRLAYHWGFGLTGRHWRDLRHWLEPYYKVTEGRDYRDRRGVNIAGHYAGVPIKSPNQDVMKQTGTYELGRVSINTTACFARYIGAQGVHCNQERYDRFGFAHSVMYPEPVELAFPSDSELEKWHEEWKIDRWRRFNRAKLNKEAEAEEPVDV